MKGKLKIVAFLVAVCVVFSLAACSSKSSSGSSGKGKDGTIKLTFWNGFTASDGEILKGIVDDFNKTNSKGIKISMDVMPWANFNEKLPAAIASKTAPDFVLMNYGDFAQYVSNGAMQPLDDFWNVKGVDKSDFSNTALQLGQLQGKQYFIPMQVQGMYLYWNKDLFKAAGLDPEKPPRTWNELVEIAPKLTNSSKNVFGFSIPKEGNPILYNWMIANGGSLTNSKQTKSTFASDATLDVLKQIQYLIYDKKTGPKSISGAEVDNLMNAGQLAIEINGPWLNNGLKKNNINYGVTTAPEGKNGKTAILDGVGFGIPASTDPGKNEAIYEFVKYWNTTAIGKKWSTENGFPPYLKSVAEDPEVQNDPIVTELYKQIDYAKPFMPGSAALSTINLDVINPMLEKLFAGSDPEQLMKDTDKKINDTLASQK